MAKKIENGNNNGVRIIQLGLGKVVSNWGTHNGVPAVFIEPVLGDAGPIAGKVPQDRELQIEDDRVSDGGVIIEIHDERGLSVVLEDFQSALGEAKHG